MRKGPFKMKGSPAKLGTVEGTSGHRSALKAKWIEQLAKIPGKALKGAAKAATQTVKGVTDWFVPGGAAK